MITTQAVLRRANVRRLAATGAGEGAALAAARDWIATQARVVEYWRDLLADTSTSADADALCAALDAHAAFLRAVGEEG